MRMLSENDPFPIPTQRFTNLAIKENKVGVIITHDSTRQFAVDVQSCQNGDGAKGGVEALHYTHVCPVPFFSTIDVDLLSKGSGCYRAGCLDQMSNFIPFSWKYEIRKSSSMK